MTTDKNIETVARYITVILYIVVMLGIIPITAIQFKISPIPKLSKGWSNRDAWINEMTDSYIKAMSGNGDTTDADLVDVMNKYIN